MDDDCGAAPVGSCAATKWPVKYLHPKDPRIAFWILPGIRGLTYSDVENYDAFLFLTSRPRFTDDTLEQLRKIRSLKKEIFFVLTKIDELIVRAEKRKRSFDERTLLDNIRIDLLRDLANLLSNLEDLFLISNHYPQNWDFQRLNDTILHLPRQWVLLRPGDSFQEFHTVNSISGTRTNIILIWVTYGIS